MSVYKAEDEIYDLMRDTVANYHPDLALVVDSIAVVMKDKASKTGGKVILGKPRKASPLFGVLGDTDYKFILEIAADEWVNLSQRQRKALMDSLLCACRAEEDDNGNMVCSLALPDVSFFYDELDRWGDWRPRPPEEGPESPLVRIFGKKAKDLDENETEDEA